MVYNPGEKVAGTTTPLYGLAAGLLMATGLTASAAVAALHGVALTLVAVFAWRLFRAAGLPWGGVAAGVLLLIDPRMVSLYGHETAMALGLALAAFALWAEGKRTAALICCALLAGVDETGVLRFDC